MTTETRIHFAHLRQTKDKVWLPSRSCSYARQYSCLQFLIVTLQLQAKLCFLSRLRVVVWLCDCVFLSPAYVPLIPPLISRFTSHSSCFTSPFHRPNSQSKEWHPWDGCLVILEGKVDPPMSADILTTVISSLSQVIHYPFVEFWNVSIPCPRWLAFLSFTIKYI